MTWRSPPPFAACDRRRLLAGGGSLLLASGCSPRSGAAAALRVFAAASLVDVLGEVFATPRAEGGAPPPPTLNAAGSSELARQIREGAEADLLIPADAAWMDALADEGLVLADRMRVLAGNRLVAVAPADAGKESGAPGEPVAALRAALAGGGRLVLADPASTPAGRYAREALTRLGVWAEFEPRLVQTDSVRSALRLVEVGEAAAGVVYVTDALAAGGRVRTLAAFDPGLHAPILYPMAPVTGGRVEDALLWMERLLADGAQAVFARHGFAPPPP